MLVLMPFAFMILLGVVLNSVIVPFALGGHIVGFVVGAVAAIVFVSFAIATVTFTRDVLLDRYP